MGIAAEVTKGV